MKVNLLLPSFVRLVCLPLIVVSSSPAEIDLNGNGLGDVWERQYEAEDLRPDGDQDGDGETNLEENRAGTDPLDTSSALSITSATMQENELHLSWPSVAGKRYQIEVTSDLRNWRRAAPAQGGSGKVITLRIQKESGRAAFLGGVHRDLWMDIAGTTVESLTRHPDYPRNPAGTFATPVSSSSENDGENYGAKFRGYFVPPRSGTYTIDLSSRDESRLLVSRNADISALQLLMTSPTRGVSTRNLDLTAGRAYYFELLHKAGEGLDFCKLEWKGPGVAGESLLESRRLAFWLGESDAIDLNAPMQFYRILVEDLDTDEDGATDWEELAVEYHPFDPHSQKPGVLDGRVLIEELGGSPPRATLTIETLVANGYEEGASGQPVAAGYLLRRKGGELSEPLVVPLLFGGSATHDSDYKAVEVIAFPADAAEVEVPISPEKDTLIEVPETVELSIKPGDAYEWEGDPLVVTIEDFEVQESTLYVTTLTAEEGVETNASGISSVWLAGDRLSATVALDFQGLTSEQTAAHIHYTVDGAAIESLGLGTFEDHLWIFPEQGQGPLTSPQAIVDALTSGQLYVNVHSSIYPAGEIRGTYLPGDGSGEFIPPEDPPPVPDYEGEEETRDIVRFLTQATFGATEALVEEVRAKGIEAWIDDQMNEALVKPTSLLNYTEAANNWEFAHNEQLIADGDPAGDPEFQPRHHNRRRGWFLGAIKGKDQLRQRVAFALSEIFVVSDDNAKVRTHQYGAAHYYDMLASHAFGNYRELLEDVTLHPIMGNYLSMIYNEKANEELGTSPDENYAREVMQLFSIGLVELHPDGTIKLDPATLLPTATYENEQITELARVFTGWSYAKRWQGNVLVDNTRFYYGGGPRYRIGVTTAPMKMFPQFHDIGEKVIVAGNVIPAQQTGEKDMEDAMDTLFHHANTPSFLSRRLIQRLVTSNPSRGYVYRVAQVFEDNGSGVRGDLGAVIKAILTDYEARSLEAAADPEYGKQREPLIRFTSILRTLDANTNLPLSDFDAHGYVNDGRFSDAAGRFRFGDTTNLLSQSPLSAPSVFNWFLPDYVFPGVTAEAGMVAPEFQTTTETWVVKSANYKYALLFNRNGLPLQPVRGDRSNDDHAVPDFTRLQKILDTDGVSALIDHLDLYWVAGAMTAETKAILNDVVANTGNNLKLKTAIYLTVVSPDFIIQR